MSGPVRRPQDAAPAAVPGRATGAFERVRALPDHRFVDGLLRSQAWIWLIGIGLLGIVAMQVSLLKLNSGIGRAVETVATLERQNASLEASVARRSAGRRIEDAANATGMVMPPAGSVKYLTVRPGTDPRWAQQRMRPVSPAARALMANGGVLPGPIVAPGVTTPAATTPAAAPATTTPPAPTPPTTQTPPSAPTTPTTPTTAAPASAPVVPAAGAPAAPASVTPIQGQG